MQARESQNEARSCPVRQAMGKAKLVAQNAWHTVELSSRRS